MHVLQYIYSVTQPHIVCLTAASDHLYDRQRIPPSTFKSSLHHFLYCPTRSTSLSESQKLMASTSDNDASSSSASHAQRQKPSASRLMLSVRRSLSQSVPKKRPSEHSVSSPFLLYTIISLDFMNRKEVYVLRLKK